MHYSFDALLISAFLAGVKRSTGLTYVALSSHDRDPLLTTANARLLQLACII